MAGREALRELVATVGLYTSCVLRGDHMLSEDRKLRCEVHKGKVLSQSLNVQRPSRKDCKEVSSGELVPVVCITKLERGMHESAEQVCARPTHLQWP